LTTNGDQQDVSNYQGRKEPILKGDIGNTIFSDGPPANKKMTTQEDMADNLLVAYNQFYKAQNALTLKQEELKEAAKVYAEASTSVKRLKARLRDPRTDPMPGDVLRVLINNDQPWNVVVKLVGPEGITYHRSIRTARYDETVSWMSWSRIVSNARCLDWILADGTEGRP